VKIRVHNTGSPSQQQAAPFWTGFSFDNSSNSRVSILIMAMVSLKGTLQEILANPDDSESVPYSLCNKATPKLGKPEKATLS
jgi:hypothetical protein